MGATLTLMVGNGGEEMQEGDSLSADEGAEPRTRSLRPKVLQPMSLGSEVKRKCARMRVSLIRKKDK